MFGIPSPYLLLGALITAIGIYFTGHHYGWVERDLEMQAEIAKKNEEAREVERAMTSKLNDNATKLEEANNVLAKKSTDLDRAIRAGRVRLPAASCVQATPSAAPAAPDQTDASESDRQTLAAIAAIVADGDKAILQLNACIDAYNEVRSQINGNR
ncbi:hypothetical protein UFOVP232_53 [uncultured Caudovirales phage]|uniref:Spanin, inner membrane subunit n=1 Tax=uncultured Caudovirales phage TaxID=2100421 RepID=A0A6J7WQW6_9CAUD|nr:hypothetical protein UFOVP232_53 [uncultured Caudovirales phage]